jgi:ABC-type amino acid transport substrate-binding protein
VNASIITRLAALLALALALTLVACGGDDDGGDDAGASTTSAAKASVKAPSGLVEPGKLTLGTDFAYPPYESIEDGEQVGFDVDLAAELAGAMGLEPNMIDTRFNSLIPGLRANRFDAILSALYITAERAKQVDYVPYFTTGNAFVVKEDGDYRPAQPDELCGRTVAILQGSDVEDITRTEIAPKCDEKLDLRSFPTDTEAFQEVAAGRADVLFTDRGVATERIKDTPQLGMTISSEEVLYPVPVGIAVRQGDEEMKKALEAALAEAEKSGALKKLLDEYGVAPVDPKLVDEALAGEE